MVLNYDIVRDNGFKYLMFQFLRILRSCLRSSTLDGTSTLSMDGRPMILSACEYSDSHIKIIEAKPSRNGAKLYKVREIVQGVGPK